MKRRQFIKASAVLSAVAYFPRISLANTSNNHKLLILVQLKGGNDSLNTFVPYTDPAYYQARGRLAISANEVLPLSNTLGMNPAMAALQSAWQEGDLAVVQGIGYPSPNRSHFRGIDIWQTASEADEFLTLGWLSQALPDSHKDMQALVLSGNHRVLEGEKNAFLLKGKPKKLTNIYLPTGTTANPTLEYILDQRRSYNRAVSQLESAFSSVVELSTPFDTDHFSSQCKNVASLLKTGLRPSIIHLSLGSFDTHKNQKNTHNRLLKQLANGLSSLRTELMAQGLWHQTSVASYSEFGRRVAVNGSSGTDHGTAASHWVLGGAVHGGLYSDMPSLTDLDNGDLKFTVDFRSYYRTISDWMQWKASPELARFQGLGFV